MKNPRLLLAAAVVIVAVVLGVVLLPGAGEDADDEPLPVTRATLTLERADLPDAAGEELLVSLPGPELNTAEINHGATVAWLRCVDGRGATVVRRQVQWPLIEEEGFPPHIHHPAAPRTLSSLRRCTLTGPGIAFSAVTPRPLPAAR